MIIWKMYLICKNMGERKIALLTDTHFGVRKGSQIFHDYFERFYNETFFPTLIQRGIRTCIHLGDVFDVRKGIDYWSLDWSKRVFFDRLRDLGIETHMIVGNHDIFYKNTLQLNALNLNLREYEFISISENPETVSVQGEPIFMVPWLCESNAELFLEERNRTSARFCMGHLQLTGFDANQNYTCDHGTDPKAFAQFDKVFSGHFHKKSCRNNITYLGNSYQLYWNDVGETRGFHILDLDTGELEFIPNPNSMYHKIYYDEKDTPKDLSQYADSYLKIVVENSTSPKRLSTFLDKLYQQGIHDAKLMEQISYGIDDEVNVEAEDTLTSLTNYVNAMDENFNKSSIIEIFKSLYIEAQEA